MSPYGNDRLPGHDRRRRELLALLDAAEPRAESARAPRRVAVPLIATVAVLAAAGAGVLVARPWDDAANHTGPANGTVPGETGVPRASARIGDPVPFDIARTALANCLKNGAVAVPDSPHVMSAMPTIPPGGASVSPLGAPPTAGSTETEPWPRRSPPPIGLPTLGEAPTGNPTGLPLESILTGGPTDKLVASESVRAHEPEGSLGNLPEKASAYRPVLTSWTDDGNGGLSPFVVGKARGPGLVACHFEPEISIPTDGYLLLPEGGDASPVEARVQTVVKPVQVRPEEQAPISSATMWGYAGPEVARIEVVAPGAAPVEAALRNGAWAVNGPFSYTANGRQETKLHAYDANGTLLVDAGIGLG